MDGASPERPAGSDELLEASWTDRGRAVRGRELRLELLMTGAFAAGLVGLIALAGPGGVLHPVIVVVLVAYAIASRADFAIGSGHVVPTQLFLVPLFVLAPAQIVPGLVFLGLALGLVGDVVLGRARLDRLAYCGGDAIHALGPALMLVVFAGGDALTAAPLVLVLAFVAQLGFDFASSALHDRLVFGTRPHVHLRVLAQVWGVDAALAPIGWLAALVTTARSPWAALAALPLVVLLLAMATDRSRRIKSAHDRLEALRLERRRREEAVLRVGDALATNLDLDALLELVGRAATEALDGEYGRATPVGAKPPFAGAGAAALEQAEQRALVAAPAIVAAEVAGHHALAGVIGNAADPIGLISVWRLVPFTAEEHALLSHLCGQAAVSAANVARHELLRDAEARLRHQAFHDALTGLANRALFAERVAEALGHGSPESVAVLYLDLDGFKLVNDTLGHDAGDELLTVAAQRIRDCLRHGDVAGRLGGDEFAVLLVDLAGPDGAAAIAERLRVMLREPIRIGERDCVVHASIGTALGSADADHESLLRRADLAMYAAKSAGGDRVERFRSEMLVDADVRAELATDLRGAVAAGEFQLRFQPIVDLRDGRVRLVEALARWQHPVRGLLAPGAFVDLAEQTGMIHELGAFVVDEACRIAATWPRRAGEAPAVTVNVSAVQLRAAGFAQCVESSLARHSLPADRLILEVTESVAMASDAETRATLEALRRIGVPLALDDFGTGYSSLSHLARMHVDLLKLDREFLAGIDDIPAQARLVGGVIQLARTLGVPVIAEGIERSAQLERLLELGGHLGQGFLLGVPAEAHVLAERLGAVEAPQPILT